MREALALVGTLRLLCEMNRKLVVHLLKSFLFRDDYFAAKGSTVFNGYEKVQSPVLQILKALRDLKEKQTELYKQQGEDKDVEQEILYLNVLIRNLQLLVHDVFKEFGRLFEEVVQSKDKKDASQINSETIQHLAEILHFKVVDHRLLQSIGQALLHLSKRGEPTWKLVYEHCANTAERSLRVVNEQLSKLSYSFDKFKPHMARLD